MEPAASLDNLPEHVLRQIHDCTFRPKSSLRHFFDPNSPENFHLISKSSNDLFFSHRPQIVVFSLLFRTFHDRTPYFSQHVSISSAKNSDDLFSRRHPFHPVTLYHCKKQPFITAH